jgi:hypothetical protein
VRIYVGNLAYDVTVEKIIGLFSRFGKVKSANVIEDKLTGRSRGFGFVEMATQEEAAAAIRALNGSSVHGRELTVATVHAMQRQPSRAGTSGALQQCSPSSQGSPAMDTLNGLSTPDSATDESEVVLEFLFPTMPEQRTLRRFPLRSFLSNPKTTDSVATEAALARICEAIGCSFAPLATPEIGSWFRRFFAQTKELATHNDVLHRVQLAERALKLLTLEGPQAQADGPRLKGAAELIKAVGANNAVIQIGSVLLVKLGTSVYVATLTQAELLHLEKNRHLLKDPQAIVETFGSLSAAAATIETRTVAEQIPACDVAIRAAHEE